MQLIRPVPVTAEQYVQENFHQQIRAPENCPNCQHAHSLEALCYYWRYVTSMLAAVLRIQVRRFLCRHCRVSVSSVLGANQKSVWQSSHCHTPIGEPVPHLFVWNLSLSPTQILSGSLRLSSLKNQDEGHPHTPNLLGDALGADSLARVCKITHPRQNWPWPDTPP